ncbi:hypothetical protein DH2020_046718 [Rehmannia glutinosa]|uniref:Uncharacterized protein n=1 Tax=Rehmannia glutinosa TaxID=99300 RepID=A0ABR0UB70_REHGL
MSEPHTEPENIIDFLVNKGNGVKGLSQINLKKIPNQFIQPPEERLDHIQISTQESVPIIDVSKWDDPKVAESICEAAAKWGFFQIINHGVPLDVLENVKRAAHDFFELPVEERRKYLKENSPTHTVMLTTSFNPLAEKVLEWKNNLVHFVGQENNEHFKLWPPVSREQVLEYMNWIKPIIRKLLEALLNDINVKPIDEVKESALMGSSAVTLLYYPKCDKWIHVTPIKGSLVVNIGDVLQILSNDRYKSVEHRVFVNGNKDRVSVPIFVNPSRDAIIGPLPRVMEPGEKPIYKPVLYSDYFNYFFSKGHDGKRTIDYAKI